MTSTEVRPKDPKEARKRQLAAESVIGLAAQLQIELEPVEVLALSGLVANTQPQHYEDEDVRWAIIRARDPMRPTSERSLLLNGLLRTLEQEAEQTDSDVSPAEIV